MDWFILVLAFIFGAIIGSFLNVVSLRYNTGMGIKGRSKCFSCSKMLGWTELVPLLSFIFQAGKCRKCKTKISWQYPIVECASGVLFALIFMKFPPLDPVSGIWTVLLLFITCLMVVIMVYDIKHKIIPDSLSYTFSVVAFLSVFLSEFAEPLSLLELSEPLWLALLAGPICALPFALIWLVSGGKWMGLGDAKLILGIGWLLGFSGAVSSITLAFWIGAVVSIIWMLATYGKLRRRYEIPFAPYLVIGMYIVLFTGIRVIDIIDFLGILMA